MSLESEILSYDEAYSYELTVFRQIYSNDLALGIDLKIGKHLEGFEAVIDNLIALTKLYNYVGFGDFVKIRDQNVIVDTLKLVDIVFQTYYPCSDFSEIVSRIRYVHKGDIILPEDHNLVVDAIKSARNCIANSVPEIELITLDTYIKMLNYVNYGEPVLSFHYNTKIDALKQLLRFIFRYIVIIEEIAVELYSEYDLTTALLEYTIKPIVKASTTIESLSYFANLIALLEPIIASLDVLSIITTLCNIVIDSLNILNEINTIVSVNIDVIESIINIISMIDVTLYTIDYSTYVKTEFNFPEIITDFVDISTLHDFPELIEAFADIILLHDFPELIEAFADITLLHDFPEFISYDLNAYLNFDYTIEEISRLIQLYSFNDLWIEPIVSYEIKTKTEHDEFLYTSDISIQIMFPFDFPVTLTGYGIPIIEYDFPQYFELIVFPEIVSELIIDSYDLFIQSMLESALTLESYDLQLVSYLLLERTLESYNLDLVYQLIYDRTFESYDLDALTQLILERYLQSLDFEVYSSEAVLEKTLESYDKPLIISTPFYKTTSSLDKTSTIQTGYEFEYILWLYGFKYRRKITITNTAQEVYDYQILIKLTPQNFDYSKVKPDGSDIRFTKDNGITKLPYWIELWNPQGESWIWVKVDYLPVGETDIFMYYGNPKAESEEAPEEVFEFFDHFDVNTINTKWKLKYGQGANMNWIIRF